MKYDYIEVGDCLELMKKLPDKSVDVSFTSPPYNDTGNENISVSSSKYGGGIIKNICMLKDMMIGLNGNAMLLMRC